MTKKFLKEHYLQEHRRVQVWGGAVCLVRNDWWSFLSLVCLVRHFKKAALKCSVPLEKQVADVNIVNTTFIRFTGGM